MTTLFFAESAEPIPPADLPEKLRRALEQHGGIPMTYTMPASHTPTADNIKQRQQRVDTLNKLDARYSKGADLGYRTALSMLVYLTMFEQGGKEDRRNGQYAFAPAGGR